MSVEAKYYHPNEDLVKVIVKAWTNDVFKKKLLTYPDKDDEAEWEKRAKVKEEQFARVRAALEAFGIQVNNPIVLTCRQFEMGYIMAGNEELFVLPHAPNNLDSAMAPASARVAMIFCPFGM